MSYIWLLLRALKFARLARHLLYLQIIRSASNEFSLLLKVKIGNYGILSKGKMIFTLSCIIKIIAIMTSHWTAVKTGLIVFIGQKTKLKRGEVKVRGTTLFSPFFADITFSREGLFYKMCAVVNANIWHMEATGQRHFEFINLKVSTCKLAYYLEKEWHRRYLKWF